MDFLYPFKIDGRHNANFQIDQVRHINLVGQQSTMQAFIKHNRPRKTKEFACQDSRQSTGRMKGVNKLGIAIGNLPGHTQRE